MQSKSVISALSLMSVSKRNQCIHLTVQLLQKLISSILTIVVDLQQLSCMCQQILFDDFRKKQHNIIAQIWLFNLVCFVRIFVFEKQGYEEGKLVGGTSFLCCLLPKMLQQPGLGQIKVKKQKQKQNNPGTLSGSPRGGRGHPLHFNRCISSQSAWKWSWNQCCNGEARRQHLDLLQQRRPPVQFFMLVLFTVLLVAQFLLIQMKKIITFREGNQGKLPNFLCTLSIAQIQ